MYWSLHEWYVDISQPSLSSDHIKNKVEKVLKINLNLYFFYKF